MSRSDNYTNFLLEWAKSGSITSFVELSEILYQDVYCAAFQLLNDRDLAFLITKQTFSTAWKNVRKYDGKTDSKLWILEIAVILCFFHIKKSKDADKKKHDKTIIYGHIPGSDLNPVEEKYNTLTLYQKLSIILGSKLKFSLYDMRNVFEDLGEIEVRDLYRDALFNLINLSEQQNLHMLSIDHVQIMVNAEERGDLKLSGFDQTLLTSIQKFKIELYELFTNIKADTSLIKEIKKELLPGEYDGESSAPKNIYEEAIKSSINDLVIKKKMLLGNKRLKQFASIKKLDLSITLFFVIMFGVVILSFLIDLSRENTPWEIQTIRGEHIITGEEINTLINEGDILKTESNSLVTINVEEFGKFFLQGQAEFILEKGFESNNIIHFDGDHLEFSSLKKPFMLDMFAKEPALQIIHPLGTLKLEASDLLLQDNVYYIELYVTDGWVEFQNDDKNLFIGKGYSLDLTNKLSVPFFKGTSEAVIAVASDPSILSLKLESILSASEEHDVLTLWHLLNLAQENERYLIVDKLLEFTPIFDRSTMEGLVALNKDDSAFLLESIKWILIEGYQL